MSKRKHVDDYLPEKHIKLSQDNDIEAAYTFFEENEDNTESFNSSVATISDEDDDEENNSDEDQFHENTLCAGEIYKNEMNTLALIKKLEKRFRIEKVPGDGNCFFHAILASFNSEGYSHEDLRKAGCQFIKDHMELFIDEAYTKSELTSYVNEMAKNNKWATNLIIYSIALMLKVSIEIYVPGCIKPIIMNEGSETKIFLLNSYNNHFEILLPLEKEGKITNNPNLTKKATRKNSKLVSNTKEADKITETDVKPKLKLLELQNQTKILSSVELLKKEILNIKSIESNFQFPKDGNSIYNEIYNYKISSTIIPQKILDKQDIKRNKNSRRTIRQEAIASFKRTCELYKIVEKTQNKHSLSNFVYEGNLKSKGYVIPFEQEIKGLIFTLHDLKGIHAPAREVLLRIQECCIGWLGMLNRIKKELKLCSCKTLLIQRSGIKKIKYYRKIDSKAPLERFQVDLADLPKGMSLPNKSYLCNVKDHFSKYLWLFIVKDKTAESAGKVLDIIFSDGHIPKIMHTDNGGEFKGYFQKVLNKYNVKHVTGRPYNPKCQGLIENSNRYAKKYLLLQYLTRESDNFNIEETLARISAGYNNKTHCVTKHKPSEVYFSKSRKLFSEVLGNINDYYANRILANDNQLILNEKIAIAATILIDKKGFIRSKPGSLWKSGVLFHSIGTVMKILDFGYIKIRVDATLLPSLEDNKDYFCVSSLLCKLTEQQHASSLGYIIAQKSFSQLAL